MEDRDIVEMYWARSEAALVQTQAKYGRYCLAIAQRILGNGEDAEECVNDVWLAAWDSIPPNRPEHLSTYLGKLVRRAAVGRLEWACAAKRGGGETALSMEELSECVPGRWSVEQALEGQRLSQAISDYLWSLAAVKRQVFVYRYWYAYSIRDIAQRFGFSETKTANMLSRARKGLRGHLEKEGLYHG